MFKGSWIKDHYLSSPQSERYQYNIIYSAEVSTYTVNHLFILLIGRIYNKIELGFDHKDDGAFICGLLYQKKGKEIFSKIDGSFTCIIQDPESTLIFRDHHGTSDQVYYNHKYFASSLRHLQNTPDFKTDPDLESLSLFLRRGYIPTPATSITNVFKLGAGELLVYKSGKIEIFKIYNQEFNLDPGTSLSVNELAEEYGFLHRKSIGKRINNSENIGILLSGGYDSGCNLVALRNIYNGDIRSFSIGFKEDTWSELPLARCMSDTFQTIHSEYIIDGKEILDLPSIVEFLGDPFVEGGLMVNYSAMKMINSTKPDIILGGDGNDQYFGTSGREIALHYILSSYKAKPIAQLIYGILNRDLFEKDTFLYRIRFHLDKILNIQQGDLFGFPEFRMRKILKDPSYLKQFTPIISDMASFEKLYNQHIKESDIAKIINQVILFKASRMADLFNQSLAFPYMDLDIYQFLQKIPVSLKCKGESVEDIAMGKLTGKYLMKHYYKSQLPSMITAKKKQGGFAPMPIFFQNGNIRNKLEDFIMNSSITHDLLDRKTVGDFLKLYNKEVSKPESWFWYRQNKAIQYFNLLTLATWWELYINKKQVVF